MSATKQAVRKSAAKKRPAPARGKAAPAVRTMNELMAFAYALEIEAAERYAEFADAMEQHNNREVADLFRKLARIEHKHAEQILEEMRWTAPPKPPVGGYQWEGLEGPETADFTTLHYLMQPYHALEIALLNEKRAFQFFTGLVRRATTDKVKRAAKEMAGEEAEHVRLIEDWMKKVPLPEPHWDADLDPPRYVD
ncbi:MAG TPA: ferritin family protein [Burkholderiales bacterium]|jgi:rubrerythrin|nr:ferritin family protein [Burkholderiales bacterium]